jgi:hypothetical protein
MVTFKSEIAPRIHIDYRIISMCTIFFRLLHNMFWKILYFLLLIICSDLCKFSVRAQTKEDDLIQNLPGLIFDPGVKQYSGYFNLSSGNLIHYW